MQAELTINIEKTQIITILKQLAVKERMSILHEFSDELISFFSNYRLDKPLSIIEYNKKLEDGMHDFRKGKIYTNEEIKSEVEKW